MNQIPAAIQTTEAAVANKSGKQTPKGQTPKQEKQKVVPRGKAQRQSNEQLNEATSARTMRSKTDAALADWNKNAPKEYRDILDAEEL